MLEEESEEWHDFQHHYEPLMIVLGALHWKRYGALLGLSGEDCS